MEMVFPTITFGTYGKVNKSLTANQDILIFGSSRAYYHYNPYLLSNQTGMTCYNTGLGGYGLFYNYALLDEIVNTQQPQIVILDLSPNVIVDPKSYAKLNIFMPYYFKYPSFKNIIKLDPNFSKLTTFFKTSIYNSTLYDYVRGEVTNRPTGNGYKGLLPEMDTTNYVPMHLSKGETFDSVKKDYLEKCIDIAIKHKIRLICIVSPTYEKFDTDNRIIGEMEELIVARGVEFYNYSDFGPLYNKPLYFKDQLHMNIKGVEVFDRAVSNRISHPNNSDSYWNTTPNIIDKGDNH